MASNTSGRAGAAVVRGPGALVGRSVARSPLRHCTDPGPSSVVRLARRDAGDGSRLELGDPGGAVVGAGGAGWPARRWPRRVRGRRRRGSSSGSAAVVGVVWRGGGLRRRARRRRRGCVVGARGPGAGLGEPGGIAGTRRARPRRPNPAARRPEPTRASTPAPTAPPARSRSRAPRPSSRRGRTARGPATRRPVRRPGRPRPSRSAGPPAARRRGAAQAEVARRPAARSTRPARCRSCRQRDGDLGRVGAGWSTATFEPAAAAADRPRSPCAPPRRPAPRRERS